MNFYFAFPAHEAFLVFSIKASARSSCITLSVPYNFFLFLSICNSSDWLEKMAIIKLLFLFCDSILKAFFYS